MATDFTVDRNTVKYVLNSSGDIASVAIDTPAIEYNTDGTYKGLLVEPASTNLCLRSEDITTTWIPNANVTVTANATTAPDGNTTADKLGDDSGGGTGLVLTTQVITLSAGTKYTASAWFKADQLAFAGLTVVNYDGPVYAAQSFGLSGAGSLGTPTAGIQDSSITAYPDGWYRCTITWTQGVADTSSNLDLVVYDSISNATVDLDGTSSIFVWGAQVEASPIATSYIPTTTASVTRNKDDISLTGASDLIGQSEGTLYLEVDWRLATGTNQNLLNLNDGTGNNLIAIYVFADELKMYAQANGSNQTNQGESSTGYSGIQKIAFAYKTDDFELYRNGSSISSDTSGSLAALGTLTDIDLARRYDGGVQANMWIRAVALYKTRLTDDQLADLTS